MTGFNRDFRRGGRRRRLRTAALNIALTAGLATAVIAGGGSACAQSMQQDYEKFRREAVKKYESFRQECNSKYAEFVRQGGKWYKGEAPLPKPAEPNPLPPRNYPGEREKEPVTVTPRVEPAPKPQPQPKPVEPIREVPGPSPKPFTASYYGISAPVRLPEAARLSMPEATPDKVADAWEALSGKDMDNAIRDCLEARVRYGLCDWAYLGFLNSLAQQFCRGDANGTTLLTAFLYSQSGYSMRLAMDGPRLVLLYASGHSIFDKNYFSVGNTRYYPLSKSSDRLQIFDYEFGGEKPLSLLIATQQKLGSALSATRTIKSKKYPGMTAPSQVPAKLIDFYNTYPVSLLNGDFMTRWAMYANTPLSKETREVLYPALRKAIAGCSPAEAANRLLNWVQTGFVYEYDDKVWGYDRAFFAEESLYYPYCDCEDRSILYSRLVRDLLGLDVALVYYPGHLATAVRFTEPVSGDALNIGGRRYTVCDPTYIGAPIGLQMPDLDYSKTRTILLSR